MTNYKTKSFFNIQNKIFRQVYVTQMTKSLVTSTTNAVSIYDVYVNIRKLKIPRYCPKNDYSVQGVVVNLSKRNIIERTCNRWGYANYEFNWR